MAYYLEESWEWVTLQNLVYLLLAQKHNKPEIETIFGASNGQDGWDIILRLDGTWFTDEYHQKEMLEYWTELLEEIRKKVKFEAPNAI